MTSGGIMKRAKWHLGIRSQSRPNDIMTEVYRAMKALNFEWKIINPFHVKVRKKNIRSGQYAKMSLQLYQVDSKSYLLDFKSISKDNIEDSQENTMSGSIPSETENQESVDDQVQLQPIAGHKTMEFFEMCSALIIQLAR